eukprot:TRINITY_DN26965_c0_g2_i1.p1 TRINITY_DN26965_c0_g2~~TRINITY_DN26965_c0_g2_i1.p1  ORF type:complete len:831 (+),score=197.62 TRINITY_DN26965_c0_g2_i1:236-2494(+)
MAELLGDGRRLAKRAPLDQARAADGASGAASGDAWASAAASWTGAAWAPAAASWSSTEATWRSGASWSASAADGWRANDHAASSSSSGGADRWSSGWASSSRGDRWQETRGARDSWWEARSSWSSRMPAPDPENAVAAAVNALTYRAPATPAPAADATATAATAEPSTPAPTFVPPALPQPAVEPATSAVTGNGVASLLRDGRRLRRGVAPATPAPAADATATAATAAPAAPAPMFVAPAVPEPAAEPATSAVAGDGVASLLGDGRRLRRGAAAWEAAVPAPEAYAQEAAAAAAPAAEPAAAPAAVAQAEPAEPAEPGAAGLSAASVASMLGDDRRLRRGGAGVATTAAPAADAARTESAAAAPAPTTAGAAVAQMLGDDRRLRRGGAAARTDAESQQFQFRSSAKPFEPNTLATSEANHQAIVESRTQLLQVRHKMLETAAMQVPEALRGLGTVQRGPKNNSRSWQVRQRKNANGNGGINVEGLCKELDDGEGTWLPLDARTHFTSGTMLKKDGFVAKLLEETCGSGGAEASEADGAEPNVRLLNMLIADGEAHAAKQNLEEQELPDVKDAGPQVQVGHIAEGNASTLSVVSEDTDRAAPRDMPAVHGATVYAVRSVNASTTGGEYLSFSVGDAILLLSTAVDGYFRAKHLAAGIIGWLPKDAISQSQPPSPPATDLAHDDNGDAAEAAPAASTQVWRKYKDEHHRLFLFNEVTRVRIYIDNPGPWQKFQDEQQRTWWWHQNTEEWFYEPP